MVSVTRGQPRWAENFRNKQFASFKLYTVILNSRMKLAAVLLRPGTHPPSRCSSPICHLVAPSVTRLTVPVLLWFVFRSPLFDLTMAPKHKSSDAGSSDMPERSHRVLPFSEKVCMCRKKHSKYCKEFNTIYPWFQAPTGRSWKVSLVDSRRLPYA